MTSEPQVSPRMLTFIRAVDELVVRVARHWLLFANLFLFVFSGLPILAPILMHYGVEGPARLIYTVYSFTCHQLSYRTWFFFGAQPYYTVDQLQHYLGVTNSATDIFYWRAFIGNPQMGYKMAWCERDAAIYGSMLLAGLVFALLRTRVKALSWRWYVAIAIVPMLVDGGTQLLMLRESTPLLRTVTGVLFGTLSVWLIYPYVGEAMRETYAVSLQQLERVRLRTQNPAAERESA